jgi:hypothetical protein
MQQPTWQQRLQRTPVNILKCVLMVMMVGSNAPDGSNGVGINMLDDDDG